MENDELRGESPSHKYARYRYWNEVLRGHLDTGFMEKKHLVVGDPVLISCLLGMGIPAKNILAVDPDPEYALKLQQENEAVHVICGDIAKVVKRHRRELASAHLHVLNPLSDELLALAFDVLVHGMKEGGFFGMSFVGSNEQGRISDGIQQQLDAMHLLVSDLDRGTAKEVISAFLDFSYEKGSMRMRRDALEALQACLQSEHPTAEQEEKAAKYIRMTMHEMFDSEPGVARLDYLVYILVKEGTTKRIGVRPLSYFHYKMADGPTMCLFLSKVTRAFPGSSINAFRRQFAGTLKGLNEVPTVDCNVNEGRLRWTIQRLVARNTGRNGAIDDDEKRFLLYLPRLFNISPATLASWVTQAQEADDGHGC